MTGDEARKALDPRLLDICREWLSVLEDVDKEVGETEQQNLPCLGHLRESGNRLLRLAYEAGYERGGMDEIAGNVRK